MGAAPRKTKQRGEKSSQATSPGYSIAKSTLKVPLTLNKVEKTKVENFDFVHLLSSSSSSSSSSSFFFFFFFFFSIKHNSKTIRRVQILRIPAIALLMKIIPTCFELRASYDWRVMASKLSRTRFAFSFVRFLAFHAIIS